MRHRSAPYLAALSLLVLADSAEARKVTIRQAASPTVTITVPAGWTVQERRTVTVLTRGERRVRVYQCGLARFAPGNEHVALARRNRAITRFVQIQGGSCIGTRGADRRFANGLKPVLGRGGPAPASDAAAEQLARDARSRTLAQPRLTGTASAAPFGFDRFVSSVFEYDQPAGYSYQFEQYPGSTAEVIHDAAGDHLRENAETCWGGTSSAEEDDALDPLLELKDWDAPPSTETSWHVSYKPIVTLPDATRLVRWTGFVADGEAIIGADGLLRRVRIEDHHMARGRSSWRTVEVVFTGFPAAITRVSPQPSC